MLLVIGVLEFPVKNGTFGGEKRPFLGKRWLFSAKFGGFLKRHFSSCGKTIAILRTFAFRAQTGFSPVTTRGFCSFIGQDSVLSVN
jgi:hypothetical protein